LKIILSENPLSNFQTATFLKFFMRNGYEFVNSLFHLQIFKSLHFQIIKS